MVEGGTPHYRFYANFIEPGSLAMMLLPVIGYAFLSKKYIGLTICTVGLFLTDSLGGFISLLLLVVVMFFVEYKEKSKNKYFALATTTIISLILLAILLPSLISSYVEKNASAATRVENVTRAIDESPIIILNNPLGIRLAIDTKSNLENEAYIGSNFIPVVYSQNGGILAFFGYTFILVFVFLFSLKAIVKYNLSLEEKVVFTSIIYLMPFIVQRPTIFESSIFAFLWAPIIIGRLSKKSHYRMKQGNPARQLRGDPA